MALTNIKIFNYNNYFNRVIKRLETLADYGTALYTYTNYNFDPGDNVSTTLIIGKSDYNGSGDYLIEYDNNENILARWFIIDSKRTRKGQYEVSLKRDVLADFPRLYANSIFSIDRCTVDSSDPRIFNPEGFTYNQIKKEEYRIFDRTACPWIVGYFDPSYNTGGYQTIEDPSTYDFDMGNIRFDEWEYYHLFSNVNIYGPSSVTELQTVTTFIGGVIGAKFIDTPTQSRYENISYIGSYANTISIFYKNQSLFERDRNADRHNWFNWAALSNKENVEHAPDLTVADVIVLTSYNGRKLKFTDGIYAINFSELPAIETIYDALDNTVTAEANNNILYHSSADIDSSRTVLYKYKTSKIPYYFNYVIMDPSGDAITYNIPATANMLADAPYKMFCMPYNVLDDYSIKIDGTTQYSDVSLEIAKDILKISTKQQVLDVQLLPYCPVAFTTYTYDSASTYNDIDTPSDFVEDVDYTVIKTVNNVTKGKIFFPTESSFKFTIDEVFRNKYRRSLTSIDYFNPLRGDPIKIKNETQFVRFCDATYNASFEMTPAKNNGITSINAYCTYKPYNPYILIAPGYDGLYGRTFDDSRGLLCQGDYSLPDSDTA